MFLLCLIIFIIEFILTFYIGIKASSHSIHTKVKTPSPGINFSRKCFGFCSSHKRNKRNGQKRRQTKNNEIASVATMTTKKFKEEK